MSNRLQKYNKVAVGGTFDRLHKGHKALLEKALELGNTVLIGLTTRKTLEKIHKTCNIGTYSTRKKELEDFLEKRDVMNRVMIEPLDDPFGPTLTDEGIDALVVSKETIVRAKEINKVRRARGLKPITITVINMVLAEDETPISSSRIRQKEIDRDGQLLTRHSNKKSETHYD